MKGVSVIICCYNSSKRLPNTIAHLAAQQAPHEIPWEIIVVNNNSSDNTKDVAAIELNKYSILHKKNLIVDEPKAGLSHARDKGVASAKYDYVIFCDDDNWLDKNYVEIGYYSMELHSSAGAIGGIGTPVCEITPPTWFESFSGYYATGTQGEQVSTLLVEDVTVTKKYVYGAGIVFRKKALNKLKHKNFNNLITDRIGDQLISGGDNEVCYAIILMGYRVLYNPLLKFQHFIPIKRLSVDYFLKLNEGYGYSGMLLLPYDYKLTGKNMTGTKTTWLWLLISSIYLFMIKDFISLIFKKNNFADQVKIRTRIGGIKSIWQNRNNLKANFLNIDRTFHYPKNNNFEEH